MSNTPMKVAVIGGGAAGFFSAINIAEKNPNTDITIFEATTRPLQKVFISGGGRCNVTHHCFDPKTLTQHYPRGEKALYSVFHRFQPEDTVEWFAKRGLKMKTEDDGRMFPVSDNSQDVIDLLLRECKKCSIKLKTKQRIQSVTKEDHQFKVIVNDETQYFDIIIMATGYSPPGWQLAKNLGHDVIKPVPSLFPFKIHNSPLEGLQGIALKNTTGQLKTPDGKTFKSEGPLLITHTGVSAPVIYRLSAYGARSLSDSSYHGKLSLDLLPDVRYEALSQKLPGLFRDDFAKNKVSNTKFDAFPHRLWLRLLEISGFNLEQRASEVSNKTIHRLVENIKTLKLEVIGRSPSKEEFVSCGGVSLNNVDLKTMESKRCTGLYFAGEILDIDALTGGFNFQACWSAGWIISTALASNAK